MSERGGNHNDRAFSTAPTHRRELRPFHMEWDAGDGVRLPETFLLRLCSITLEPLTSRRVAVRAGPG